MDFTYRKTQTKPQKGPHELVDPERAEDASARARQPLHAFRVPQGNRHRNPPLRHHPCGTDSLEAQRYLCRWQNPSTLRSPLQSPNSRGGRATLLGGRNRESQERRPVFVSVYGTPLLSKEGRGTRRCVPAGGCCRDGGAAGASRGHRPSCARRLGSAAPARLPRPTETEPSLGSSSRRGSRDAILCACRTPGRDGIHQPPPPLAGRRARRPDTKGYGDAEGWK